MRVRDPVAHIQAMEPFRIITTPEELACLRTDSIVCPPRFPGHAYRKAWTGMVPNEGRSDIYLGFGSTRELDHREVWAILIMHCPVDAPEVWVLWDAAAKALEPLKPSAWMTVIPSRRPAKKAHTTLGYAKSAVRGRIYGSRGASEDMAILQMDPATGKYEPLFTIPAGTPKAQLPW